MRKPSAEDLRKLKDRAAELVAKGKLEKAADAFREVCEGDPKDVASRQKLAEVLRRAGRIPDAIQAYREVADRFGQDGLLIKAIAISKTILELDPQHVETQSALAALYARKAAAEGARPPPRTVMAMAAAKAAAQPPPPPAPPPARPETADRMVAIALGPPPPVASPEPEAISLDVLIEPEPLPAPPPAPAAADTAFAQIAFAAEAAIDAGVVEEVVLEPEPLDLPPIDDEPLGPASAPAMGGGGVGDEVLELAPEPEAIEISVEPEPLPAPVTPPPRAPPAAPVAPAPRAPPPAALAPPRPGPAAPARPAAARPAPPPPAAGGLPRVPIFSDLSRDAFVALTTGMVLHRVPEGEAVIREGEDGTSFYVVATGRLAVSKRGDTGGSVVLAHLGEGDFFGEMALLSGTARAATVTAEQDSEVLELPAQLLREVAGKHPHLAQSLRRFYRQRLLANAMAVSPIFRPFPVGDRKLIIERFRARQVAVDEVVVREGEPSDGLYVVLEGAVDVVKRGDGGAAVAVGHLREGDLFGEMSCLRKAPASATVVVRRPGTLLRLPRRDFDELVVSYPQILELVSELSEERAENLDAILSGHAEWTEDGLVLT